MRSTQGLLRRKGGRYTIHFTAESANIELLIRTIHSVNQLSISGAVSSWCDELAEKDTWSDIPGSGEIHFRSKFISYRNSWIRKLFFFLVQNQTRTEEAAGNSRRDHLQRFKMLDPDEQFCTICESAGFIRPVSVGMYYRTSDFLNDGFGHLTASCREHTPHRAHQDSVLKLQIQRHTEIGPVLDVKTFCHLGVHGIGIQIPSTSGVNTHVWVICQGPNRYVDELRYKATEYSPGSLEEADYGSMQETDAE